MRSSLLQLSFFAALLVFFSCSSNEAGQRSGASTVKEIDPNSESPAASVTGFLKWYRQHMDSLGSLQMVNNVGVTSVTGEAGLYSVNFAACERFLDALKSSGYVGDNYLNKWRVYFQKCDADFREHPQKEGPPSGFDFDFVMLSQDARRDLNDLEDCRIAEEDATRNNAIVILDFPSTLSYPYFLSNEAGHWLIQDIQNMPTSQR